MRVWLKLKFYCHFATGGACGYGSLVKQFPFDSKVASASPDLFKGGKGCGSCYQVRWNWSVVVGHGLLKILKKKNL